MLAVVLLMYALTAKLRIIIGVQMISGAVLFVSITANVLRVYVRWRLEALHLILPQKLIKRTNVE